MLKELRLKKNLTQQFVAEKAKITRPAYTMIETGRRRPSVKVAKRIAKTLGIPNKWYELIDV